MAGVIGAEDESVIFHPGFIRDQVSGNYDIKEVLAEDVGKFFPRPCGRAVFGQTPRVDYDANPLFWHGCGSERNAPREPFLPKCGPRHALPLPPSSVPSTDSAAPRLPPAKREQGFDALPQPLASHLGASAARGVILKAPYQHGELGIEPSALCGIAKDLPKISFYAVIGMFVLKAFAAVRRFFRIAYECEILGLRYNFWVVAEANRSTFAHTVSAVRGAVDWLP
jgi:hypothetical protein